MKRTQEYERRLNKHYDELKWLYCELYNNNQKMFDNLMTILIKKLMRLTGMQIRDISIVGNFPAMPMFGQKIPRIPQFFVSAVS